MERQNRLLTVLATILLLLVAIAVFGKKAEDAPTDPDAPPERKLLTLESADAVSLTLTTPQGSVAFTKTDGVWKMTAPRELPVEERRVTEVIDRFASLKVQEKGFDGAAADFGLDPEHRMSVAIGTKDGTTRTVYIGRDTPVGYRSYVAEAESGPALLASSRVSDLAKRGPDDFRSKELWTVSSGSAHRIRIEQGGTAVVLRKDDHGWWLGDDGPRASSDAVQEWLSKVAYLQASGFLDDADPAAVGLAPPTARLTVDDDGGTHTLELGKADDQGVPARSTGGIVRIAKESADVVKLDGWLDDTLVPVRRSQVDNLEVVLGEKSVRYGKTDGAWKDAAGADTTAADPLLDALEQAKADRAGTPPDLGATWGSITLGQGTTLTEKVTIGAELPEGGRAAKDAAGGPAFRVPAATLTALQGALKPDAAPASIAAPAPPSDPPAAPATTP